MKVRIGSYLLVGAIAAALLVYAFGKIDGYLSQRDAVIADSSRALLKIHAGLVRYRLKLAAAEQRQALGAAAAHSAANVLRTSLAGMPPALQRPILVRIAAADSTAYMKCSVALLTCQERASLAEMEARTLATQLREQLKVKDHRCGIFAGYGGVLYNAPNATARFAAQLGVGCRLMRIPFLP